MRAHLSDEVGPMVPMGITECETRCEVYGFFLFMKRESASEVFLIDRGPLTGGLAGAEALAGSRGRT